MAHVGTAVVTFVQKWAQRTGVSDWKMSTLTYMDPMNIPTNARCNLRDLKHENIKHDHTCHEIHIFSKPESNYPRVPRSLHTHRWAYLDCPSLDRPSFYLNVFKAGRTSHRCAKPPKFLNALNSFSSKTFILRRLLELSVRLWTQQTLQRISIQ